MTNKQKHAGGRPKDTPFNREGIADDWQQQALKLYTEGASDVVVRVKVFDCICHETFARWLKEIPEFSETIKRGRLLSQAWWEQSGRTNLSNKDFSYRGWIMNMNNRFKKGGYNGAWGEKLEVEHEINDLRDVDAPAKETREEWEKRQNSKNKVLT